MYSVSAYYICGGVLIKYVRFSGSDRIILPELVQVLSLSSLVITGWSGFRGG